MTGFGCGCGPTGCATEEQLAGSGDEQTEADIASVQNRYNVLDREHEPVLATCERAGIAFLPRRPVAAGTSGAQAEIATIAAEINATPTQVALAWLLGHSPVMLPIPGTAQLKHLEENLAAERVRLSPTHQARLNQLAGGSR